MRSRGSNFGEVGHGGQSVPEVIGGRATGRMFPEDFDPWCGRVVRDHMMWTAYGCGFDMRDMDAREYQAHAALVSGIRRREREEANKAERQRTSYNR